MECEASIYDQNCGCIMYYLPIIREDVNICGGADQLCVQNVMHMIESKTNDSFMCNCLPSCYAINYEAAISAAPILTQASHSHVEYKSSVLSSHDVSDLAILNIFFMENSFRSQIKEELIGFTEFLCKWAARGNHSISFIRWVSLFTANTGGLLGLFMGFSVVSIIELLYFMTFRPYCAQQRLEGDEHFHPTELFAAATESKKSKRQSFVDYVKRIAGRIHARVVSIWPANANRASYPYLD